MDIINPASHKHAKFRQILTFFWKLCDVNFFHFNDDHHLEESIAELLLENMRVIAQKP